MRNDYIDIRIGNIRAVAQPNLDRGAVVSPASQQARLRQVDTSNDGELLIFYQKHTRYTQPTQSAGIGRYWARPYTDTGNYWYLRDMYLPGTPGSGPEYGVRPTTSNIPGRPARTSLSPQRSRSPTAARFSWQPAGMGHAVTQCRSSCPTKAANALSPGWKIPSTRRWPRTFGGATTTSG